MTLQKYYYETYSRITIIGVKIADLKNSRCNPLGKANDAKIVVITMKFFDVLLLGGNFASFFTERFVSYFRNLSLVSFYYRLNLDIPILLSLSSGAI